MDFLGFFEKILRSSVPVIISMGSRPVPDPYISAGKSKNKNPQQASLFILECDPPDS
jgi:hypothetical protein